MTTDGLWRPEYVTGDAWCGDGWYAARRSPAGAGCVGTERRGPFDSEADAGAWCDRENAGGGEGRPATEQFRELESKYSAALGRLGAALESGGPWRDAAWELAVLNGEWLYAMKVALDRLAGETLDGGGTR